MVGVLGLLVGAGFLAMVGTFAYQGYLYLKWGHWMGHSVTYFCGAYLGWGWCNSPNDWIGLHNLLSWLNAGAFAFLLSVAVMFAAIAATEGK